MNTKITFITSNKNKLAQVQKYLSIPLVHRDLDLPEIQSLDVSVIVKHKVQEAYKAVRQPVLIEDVSLTINNLGKLPGPFIKWFLKELGTAGTCAVSSLKPDKSAISHLCYGFHDGMSVHLFSGIVKGSIATQPAGEGGFGWDAIFIPEGYTITRAQMDIADYEKSSTRKIALEKFEAFIIKKYNLDIA